MWAQKLNKLDDENFLKRGIGTESKKVCKQVKDRSNKYRNKLEIKRYGRKLTMELKGYYRTKGYYRMLRHLLSLCTYQTIDRSESSETS